MKRTLLYLLLGCITTSSFGQCLQVQSVDVTEQNDGLNVNLKTVALCGAGFIGSDYTIEGNVINLNACFWVNLTLPVLYFNHNFQIPLEENQEYTMNLTVYASNDVQSCDHYSIAGTYTAQVLATDIPTKAPRFSVFPNPANNVIHFSQPVLNAGLYDLAGRLVKHSPTTANQIDVSDLPDGIYLIKTATENGQFSDKIIVRR